MTELSVIFYFCYFLAIISISMIERRQRMVGFILIFCTMFLACICLFCLASTLTYSEGIDSSYFNATVKRMILYWIITFVLGLIFTIVGWYTFFKYPWSSESLVTEEVQVFSDDDNYRVVYEKKELNDFSIRSYPAAGNNDPYELEVTNICNIFGYVVKTDYALLVPEISKVAHQ